MQETRGQSISKTSGDFPKVPSLELFIYLGTFLEGNSRLVAVRKSSLVSNMD